MRVINSLELNDAQELLAHLLATATNDDLNPVAICIVDATGKQLVAATMDGTKTPSIVTAHNKAVTAIEFGRDTIEFRYQQGADGTWTPADDGWDLVDIAAASKISPVFVPWAGGCLVWHRGIVVGAVGISNRSELEDHDLASSRPMGWGF